MVETYPSGRSRDAPESSQPDDAPCEPAERLSAIAKARLQRSVLAALKQGPQKQGSQNSESQQPLRVAQSPDIYRGRPTETEQAIGSDQAEQAHDLNPDFSQLIRGGRDLRGRLIVDFSGMLQSLHWLVELVSISTLPNVVIDAMVTGADVVPTPDAATTADPSQLSLAQLGRVVTTMLRGQSGLCAASIAKCQALNFDELLRVQRGPRDPSDVRQFPTDRLRHCAASLFHQSVVDAPSQTPILELDRSVGGWPRIVLGLPLTTTQLPVAMPTNATVAADVATVTDGAAWGLAIVEADIDRLVEAQIVAAGVDARVTLIDGHDRILFSTAAAGVAAGVGEDGLRVDPLSLVLAMAQTGEVQLPAKGLWGTQVNCPAPLDNLWLVLAQPDKLTSLSP